MTCDLLKMIEEMPNVYRETDKYTHILIHQNQEIIRLLKKVAGEEEIVVATKEIVEEKTVEEPKKKRAKRNSLLPKTPIVDDNDI